MHMGAIEKLISVALAEEGYLEKSKTAYDANHNVLDSKTDGAGHDNYQKYARDLWNVKYFNSSKQGVAWCAVFAAWCYYTAFGKTIALKLQCQPTSNNAGAGCSSAANYYKAKGRFHTDTPMAGDQIFFNASDGDGFGHTGIVEKVANGKVYTIEGNTSAGTSVIENGGAVCRKSYTLNNSRIGGYGRPDWSIVPDDGEDEGGGSMPDGYYKAVVTAPSGKTVNLRKTASASAQVLYQVPIGEYVTVVEETNDTWYRVTYPMTQTKTVNGYMMRKYLNAVQEDEGTCGGTGEVTREEFDELCNRVRAIENRLGM